MKKLPVVLVLTLIQTAFFSSAQVMAGNTTFMALPGGGQPESGNQGNNSRQSSTGENNICKITTGHNAYIAGPKNSLEYLDNYKAGNTLQLQNSLVVGGDINATINNQKTKSGILGITGATSWDNSTAGVTIDGSGHTVYGHVYAMDNYKSDTDVAAAHYYYNPNYKTDNTYQAEYEQAFSSYTVTDRGEEDAAKEDDSWGDVVWEFNRGTNSTASSVVFKNITFEGYRLGEHYGRDGALIKLTGGSSTLENFTLRDYTDTYDGGNHYGAITLAAGGQLAVNSSNFENMAIKVSKEANDGNKQWADGAAGGALYVQGANNSKQSQLSVTGSNFSSVVMESTARDVWGGAIYNEGYVSGISNSKFINNKAYASGINAAYGGAIVNGGPNTSRGVATIAAIDGGTLFQGNSAESASGNAYGGAIYNNLSDETALIGKIDATFENNKAVSGSGYAYGGAIYNTGTITSLTGKFTGNSAEAKKRDAYGGAIYNTAKGTISITDALFSQNAASGSSKVQGGAIYNSGTATISGTEFENNTVVSESASAIGGAIRANSGTLTVTGGSFSNNAAKGKNASGGAIYSANSTTTISNTKFENNTASATAKANGGAVYNWSGGTTVITNTSFSGNSAQGGTEANGGAIYNEGDLTLVADGEGKETTFSNNYVQKGDSKTSNAIYSAGGDAVITLSAINGGTITFDDEIDGADGYKISITSDSSNSGTINLNRSVNSAAVTMTGGNVHIDGTAENADSEGTMDNASLTMSGGTLYTDNKYGTVKIKTLNVSGGTVNTKNLQSVTDGTQYGKIEIGNLTSTTELGMGENGGASYVSGAKYAIDIKLASSSKQSSDSDKFYISSATTGSVIYLDNFNATVEDMADEDYYILQILFGGGSDNTTLAYNGSKVISGGVAQAAMTSDMLLAQEVGLYKNGTGKTTTNYDSLYVRGAKDALAAWGELETDEAKTYTFVDSSPVQLTRDVTALGGTELTLAGETTEEGKRVTGNLALSYTDENKKTTVHKFFDNIASGQKVTISNMEVTNANFGVNSGGTVKLTDTNLHSATINNSGTMNFDDTNLYVSGVNTSGFGVIVNNSGTINGDIGGSIIGNTTSVSSNSVKGGMIINTGNINGAVSADFSENKLTSSGGWPTVSGAVLYNASGAYISSISGSFNNNSVSSQNANEISGGAIYNEGTIDTISGNFSGNQAYNAGQAAYGGAIYNSGTINNLSGSFTDNKAIGKWAGLYAGGAIYNSGTITVTATKDKDTIFSGNQAYDYRYSVLSNAIYNSGTLNLAAGDGKIVFNDAISGSGLTNAVINLLSGETYFYNTVAGKTFSVADGAVAQIYTSSFGGSLSSIGTVANAGTMNYYNNIYNYNNLTGKGKVNIKSGIFRNQRKIENEVVIDKGATLVSNSGTISGHVTNNEGGTFTATAGTVSCTVDNSGTMTVAGTVVKNATINQTAGELKTSGSGATIGTFNATGGTVNTNNGKNETIKITNFSSNEDVTYNIDLKLTGDEDGKHTLSGDKFVISNKKSEGGTVKLSKLSFSGDDMNADEESIWQVLEDASGNATLSVDGLDVLNEATAEMKSSDTLAAGVGLYKSGTKGDATNYDSIKVRGARNTLTAWAELATDEDKTYTFVDEELFTVGRDIDELRGKSLTIKGGMTEEGKQVTGHLNIAGYNLLGNIGQKQTVNISDMNIQNAEVESKGTVNLTDTTFSSSHLTNKGTMTANSSTFDGNSLDDTEAQGGAVYNNSGTFTASSTTFRNNYVSSANGEAQGGAVYNKDELTVTGGSFSGNAATGGAESRGGAIYNSGTATISGTEFKDNKITTTGDSNKDEAYGGAIYHNKGTMTVTGASFSNNTATGGDAKGGAIYNNKTMTVKDTSFDGNIAAGEKIAGGAIYNKDTLYLSAENANMIFSDNKVCDKNGENCTSNAIYNEKNIYMSTVNGKKIVFDDAIDGKKGNGAIYVTDGAVDFNAAVAGNKLSIAKDGDVSANAGDLQMSDSKISNDGALNLSGNDETATEGATNSNAISGTGTTTITSGKVVNAASIAQAYVNIAENATLTQTNSSASVSATGKITNNGTFTATGGTVSGTVKNAGTMTVAGTVAKDATIKNTGTFKTDGKNETVTVKTDGKNETVTVGSLQSSENAAVDIKNKTAETVTVGGLFTSGATVAYSVDVLYDKEEDKFSGDKFVLAANEKSNGKITLKGDDLNELLESISRTDSYLLQMIDWSDESGKGDVQLALADDVTKMGATVAAAMDSSQNITKGFALATTETENDTLVISGYEDDALAAWAELDTDEAKTYTFVADSEGKAGRTLTRNVKALNGTELTIKGGTTEEDEQVTGNLNIAGYNLLENIGKEQKVTISDMKITNAKIGNSGELNLADVELDSTNTVTNNATLNLAGENTIDNITGEGTASVMDGTTTVAGKLEQKTVTVSGADRATLVNNGAATVAETLTVGNGTVSNTGTLSLKDATIAANGKIDGTGTTTISGTVVNDGTFMQNEITVDKGASLASDAAKVGGKVHNAGTLTLSGGNETVSANASEIDGNGTTTIAGGTVTNGKAITQETVEVAAQANFTNSGTIKANVTNSGVITVADNGSITGQSIANSGTITSAADKLSGKINNSGTLKFTGGTNSNTISGAGTTTIAGEVTNSGSIGNKVTVEEKASLTNSGTINNAVTVAENASLTNNAYISGSVVNNGTLSTSGSISGDVVNNSGASFTATAGTVSGTVDNSGTMTVAGTVASGATINQTAGELKTSGNETTIGTFNVTGGTVNTANKAIETVTINNLKADSAARFAIDLTLNRTTQEADKFVIGSASEGGTIYLSDFHISAEDMPDEQEYVLQVLEDNSGKVTLAYDDSKVLNEAQAAMNAREVLAKDFGLYKSGAKGDADKYDSIKIRGLKDALAAWAELDTNEAKTYTFDTTTTKTLSRDVKALNGTELTIKGGTTEEDEQVTGNLNIAGYNLLENIGKEQTVNISDMKITNANIGNSGELNLASVELDSTNTVENSKTLNVADSKVATVENNATLKLAGENTIDNITGENGETTVTGGTTTVAAKLEQSKLIIGEKAAVENNGIVSAAVENSGTVTNKGTISGATTNFGTITNSNSATVTGTVTNEGKISGGKVEGTVDNKENAEISAGTVFATGESKNSGTISSALTVGDGANASTFANTGILSGEVSVAANSGLTNNGKISNAVTVAEKASLTNEKEISGEVTNAGTVSNSGTMATVTNSGIFTNNGKAALITGKLTNEGELINTADATIVNLVNRGSATNSGTISGTVENSKELANNGIISGEVTNSGTISNNGTVTGTTTNSGTLINKGTMAAVTNSGTFDNTSGTAGDVINNGRLTSALANVGDVQNNGIFDLIGGGTLTNNITGSGTMNVSDTLVIGSGTLSTGVNLAENATLDIGSKDVVLEHATLNGTLKMTLDKISAWSSDYEGASLKLTNGGTIGSDAKLSLTVAKGMLKDREGTGELQLISGLNEDSGDFSSLLSNNRYTVTAGSTKGTYVVHNTATTSEVLDGVGNHNNKRTAAAWDAAEVPADNETAQRISTALNELSQHDKVRYAEELTNTAPSDSQLALMTAREINNIIGREVTRRYEEDGCTCGEPIKRWSPWMQGIGGYAKQDNQFEAAGFTSHTAGYILGLDGSFNCDTAGGIGYAFNRTKADSKGRDTDIDGHTLFVYGKYQPHFWYVRGMLSYGMADYTEKSNVAGTMIHSKYDVHSVGSEVAFGYELLNGWTPELGLRYVYLMPDDYTDSAGQKVNNEDVDVLTTVAMMKYRTRSDFADGELKPEFYAGITYDVLSDNTHSGIRIGDTAYGITGKKINRFGVETGAALTYSTGKWDVSAGYDLGVREDYISHTGLLKLRYNF